MNHSGAAELYPTGAFAWTTAFSLEPARAVTSEAREIKLGRRFREREVRRAKPSDGVSTVHSLEPFGNRALQMSHRDVLVDTETFELMEHRSVRHIRRVASKNLTRREYPQRYTAAFHRADLYGRCL